MSSTLDMKGKEWYKEKLKPVGFFISDNPYSPSHTATQRNFALMSQWPKIEYGHIFAYIISKPGAYIYSHGKQLEEFKWPCEDCAVYDFQQWKCRLSARLSWLSSMLHGHDRVLFGRGWLLPQQNTPCISTDQVIHSTVLTWPFENSLWSGD